MEILIIIVAHFIGDWWLQSRRMAENKSKDLKVLAHHGYNIGMTLGVAALILFWEPSVALLWVFINTTLHMGQDWFLWRLAGKYVAQSIMLEKTEDADKLNESLETVYGTDFNNIRVDNINPIDIYKSKSFWNVVGLDQTLHYLVLFASYFILI